MDIKQKEVKPKEEEKFIPLPPLPIKPKAQVTDTSYKRPIQRFYHYTITYKSGQIMLVERTYYGYISYSGLEVFESFGEKTIDIFKGQKEYDDFMELLQIVNTPT